MGRFLLNWTHRQQLRRPLCRPGGNCTTNRQPLCRGISPYSTTPSHSRVHLLSAFNSRSCPGCSSNSKIRELRCGEGNWFNKEIQVAVLSHAFLFISCTPAESAELAALASPGNQCTVCRRWNDKCAIVSATSIRYLASSKETSNAS